MAYSIFVRSMKTIIVSICLLAGLARIAQAEQYDRKAWPHWKDTDGDCQDARQEALISWARASIQWKSDKRCKVKASVWICPYTGERITDASKLDADHVVPLKWAHSHGGARWAKEKRRQFANDQANIIPVSASANRSKGAKPPWRWLPPRTEYACKYLKKWQAIVKRYGLILSGKEARSLRGYLGRYCRKG